MKWKWYNTNMCISTVYIAPNARAGHGKFIHTFGYLYYLYHELMPSTIERALICYIRIVRLSLSICDMSSYKRFLAGVGGRPQSISIIDLCPQVHFELCLADKSSP